MNEIRKEDQPVIPLPNPGEGGPVYPGNSDNSNTPVIPLPNPGEGGPVYPGNIDNSNTPVIPLPNPGEGGPVYPGNNTGNGNTGNNILSGIIGTIITTYPRPNAPCKFCNTNSKYGTIRFLNTASGYNPFMIYVNSSLFASSFNYGEVTEYEKVSYGMQTISVLGENGYIFIQKQVMIPQGKTITIAIINTESGIDLYVINDTACTKPFQAGCIRACNLSVNSGPLNVIIGQHYITFNSLEYKDVADFKNIWPGDYNYYVSTTAYNRPTGAAGNVLLSGTIGIDMNVSYTIYLFNWDITSSEAIRALIVEEH